MSMMRPFWAAQNLIAAKKSLVMTGPAVTYGSATSSMTLPAAKVFAGGMALAFWTNRDNASLPSTPAGWTLLKSVVYQSNHGGVLFGKLTPVSQNETLPLSVTGKNGCIWGMKFEDGTPIEHLRLAANSPTPVASNISGTISNITAAKADAALRYALGLLWQRGDTAIAETITGLEGGALVSALFSFQSADDGFRGVATLNEDEIRAASGNITFGASGLTSGNSMVHLPAILDLSQPPP